LPDVNVWLALADRDHAHHPRARRYWETESADRIGFCRVTMLELLRLCTNSKVMRGHPFTPPEVWHVYRTLQALPEVTFVEEPAGVEAQMSAWSDADDFSVGRWTDCYLASVALLAGCRLVPFDGDFKRFAGLDFYHLEP
jgi:toxin-antitoxin system PIN domain toxin